MITPMKILEVFPVVIIFVCILCVLILLGSVFRDAIIYLYHKRVPIDTSSSVSAIQPHSYFLEDPTYHNIVISELNEISRVFELTEPYMLPEKKVTMPVTSEKSDIEIHIDTIQLGTMVVKRSCLPAFYKLDCDFKGYDILSLVDDQYDQFLIHYCPGVQLLHWYQKISKKGMELALLHRTKAGLILQAGRIERLTIVSKVAKTAPSSYEHYPQNSKIGLEDKAGKKIEPTLEEKCAEVHVVVCRAGLVSFPVKIYRNATFHTVTSDVFNAMTKAICLPIHFKDFIPFTWEEYHEFFMIDKRGNFGPLRPYQKDLIRISS